MMGPPRVHAPPGCVATGQATQAGPEPTIGTIMANMVTPSRTFMANRTFKKKVEEKTRIGKLLIFSRSVQRLERKLKA